MPLHCESAARRPGKVVVLVAVSLIAVFGMVALSIDGGVLMAERRRVQAAADAAAMAGACVLYDAWPEYRAGTTLPINGAQNAAVAMAAANGYAGAGVADVSAVTPPTTGPYAGRQGFVEVNITFYQRRYFSAIFSRQPIPIRARAVARAEWADGREGILILNYTGKSALNAQGNGAFTAIGGPVIVNSNNSAAVTTSGNGFMQAPAFYVTGGTSIGSNSTFVSTTGVIETGVHPTPDPLSYLPAPPVPPNGTMTTENIGAGNKRYTLTPGRYSNLPLFSTGDEVILKQASASISTDPLMSGVFYIDGGGFKSTGATIKMDTNSTGGVMIYNQPNGTQASQKIQITGNAAGSVNLQPLTSGPYSGLMMWQDRNSPVDVLVEGNGTFKVAGTFYAAGAKLNINGNGGTFTGDNGETIQGSAIGSQYISQDLSLGGNGNIKILYNGGKVAKIRILTLVE